MRELEADNAYPALQTWTIRRELRADPRRTLSQIRDIGLKCLEVSGTGGKTPTEFSTLCAECGLKIIGTHEPSLRSSELSHWLDEIRSRCSLFDSRFVTVSLDIVDRGKEANYVEYAKLCSKVGRILREDGITLCYHCYPFDLTPLDGVSNGMSGLDILLKRTPPEELSFELDTFFIHRSGVEYERILEKCGPRCKLVHLNDIDNEGKQAPLGTGKISWVEIVQAFLEMGPIAWFVIEHETRKAMQWILQSCQHWEERLQPLVETIGRAPDGERTGL